MPRRPGRPTLDCKASAADGWPDSARGEHALGLEVAGERQGGSGRGARGWAAEAAYGDGYPAEDQLLGPTLDAAAYPVDPGYRGRTSGRPRPADMPPGPPQPPGPRHAAATRVPGWVGPPGTARRGRREPPVGQAGRPDDVRFRRPLAATARTRAARRPRPGQRSSPTAGGQPRPPDGGGDHDVERAAGSPQRRPDCPARPPPRSVPQLQWRIRPDGGRAAGRRRRAAAVQAAGSWRPGRAGRTGRTGARVPATGTAVAHRRPVDAAGGPMPPGRDQYGGPRSVRVRSVRSRAGRV